MEHYLNLASRGREAKAVPASNEQARFETLNPQLFPKSRC